MSGQLKLSKKGRPVAREIVTPSLTSSSLGDVAHPWAAATVGGVLRLANPHLDSLYLSGHGVVVVEVSAKGAKSVMRCPTTIKSFQSDHSFKGEMFF
jgi:hypothetical protein